MLIKWGVYGSDRLHNKILSIFPAITETWNPQEPIITAIGEGTHQITPTLSKHYYNPIRAIDLRIPSFVKTRVAKLQEKLGKEYRVINEGNHIHIQWNGPI